MNFIRWLLGLKTSTVRSHKNGDKLTYLELTHIYTTLDKGHPTCPDCRVGRLMRGSHSNSQSLECACSACGSEFTISEPRLFVGERISNKGPRLLESRHSFYSGTITRTDFL